MSANARDYGVVDELHRIGGACVFRLAVVVVVRDAGVRVERHILKHATEPQRVPDLRLVLLRKLDALGVASALEVEDAVGTPSVLVVADEVARRVGRERGLARSRQAEK